MDGKDSYVIKRKKKKIRLVHIAQAIGCSPSMLSKYETGCANMSHQKTIKYREYIDSV